MSFANLFTRLSAVEEDVGSPAQPAFMHRNEAEDGRRGNARKRKLQAEQTGPYKQKQFHQAQTTRSYNATSFEDDDTKATRYHTHNTESQHASVGFTKDMTHNQSDKAAHNNKGPRGQNYKTKNNHNHNANKQQQKNQHQQKDRWRPANRGGNPQTGRTWGRGGGDRKNTNDKQDFQVKRPRFMTEEFKDQNGVMVEGRLVCRHFLWGRCIKEDTCQLEHIQGYNDLVKEVCKFYIQGFCTKGERCPYMHKSFPCKFFHRRGECSQGADCKFSHEPLNDVTTKLLNEALKRERDLYELTKNAEQESSSSGRPENTEESEIIEANGTCDALLPPLRPYFYNSAETNAEKESLLCPTEQLAEDIEEAVPSHPSDAAQPHPPPSSNINHEEPVCYSVEAVLGPQLFKPFPSFFTTPGCEATQSKVPYSVDAVLRSCKSAPLTVRTVSYTPNTDGEEITDPLLSSESRNVKVLYSQNTANAVNQSQEKMFKSLSSLQVNTGLVSKTCPSLTPASRDYKKQSVNMPESLKPAQRASHEVKLELLHSPVTVAEKSSNNKEDVRGSMRLPADNTSTSKSEGVLSFGRINRKSIFSRPPSQTCTSKHPTQLRPHLSVVTLDLHASIKPPCPSSSFTEFKDGAAATVEPVTSSIKTRDSANSVGRHFAAKQPTEILLHSKMTQSGLKRGTRQRYSTEVTAGCSSKMSHSGDLAVGCKNTLKRPFHSLFASSIIDILQPIDDSVTSSSCPQGFILSSCPSPQSADCTSICVKSAVEPDKASARSFLSLFAAPLSAAPPPCMKSQSDYSRTSSCSQKSNQSVDNASNSKQRTSNLGTPLPCLVRTDVKEIPHVPRSHNFSPNPKLDNEDSSAEHINQPRKQMVVPVCLVSDSLSAMSASPSTPHVQQQDTSSHRGSAVATTANSVLKTLFLSLSPYQRDAEQQ